MTYPESQRGWSNDDREEQDSVRRLPAGPTGEDRAFIRLLYFINGLGPGGAERSLAELLPAFQDNGIDPVVVCINSRSDGVEAAIRRLGCDVRFLNSTSFPGRVLELRKMIASGSFDLIHTTLFESDIIGRLAAAATGVPVLTSLVNTSYEPVRLRDPNVGRFGLWATRVADGWTARHLTTWFHAITRAVKDSAVEHLGISEAKVTVIERGRSRDRLGETDPMRRRETRRRLGVDPDAEVVVNVARQEFQKGQKYLLKAADFLLPRRPLLQILVCGREGHATAELRNIHERLGLGDRVRFLGDRDDVPDILAAADVFAFPSVYEGLGGAVVEAMAMGLPVVCSDLPALREVVEEGCSGLMVEPEDPRSLAEALSRILDDPRMGSSFGNRGVEIYRERFTIDRSAERMIHLYRRLVRRTSGTTPRVVSRSARESGSASRGSR